MSKMVSKYTASFDYFHKTLIISSAASSTISIPSFATVIGALAGIARASFSFAFWITAEIVKKMLKTTQIKTKSVMKLLCQLGVN